MGQFNCLEHNVFFTSIFLHGSIIFLKFHGKISNLPWTINCTLYIIFCCEKFRIVVGLYYTLKWYIPRYYIITYLNMHTKFKSLLKGKKQSSQLLKSYICQASRKWENTSGYIKLCSNFKKTRYNTPKRFFPTSNLVTSSVYMKYNYHLKTFENKKS